MSEPRLLVRAAKALLRRTSASSLFIKAGIVKHQDLFLLWSDLASDLYTPLLSLFEIHDLCFRLHDSLDIEATFADGSSLFPMVKNDVSILHPFYLFFILTKNIFLF